MKSDIPNIKIKMIAFYLVLLIVVIFSIPQVQTFVSENIVLNDEVVNCTSQIITEDYIKYFGIAFILTAMPAMILYSRFIYKKFGVFITKFHGKYSPELHFKEFVSSNIQNRIFGFSLFVVWLCACCFIFYGIAAIVRCNLLK